LFFIFGVTWILTSDTLLGKISTSLQLSISSVTFLNCIKGVFFILVTSVLIYFSLKRSLRKIEKSQREYKDLFYGNPAPMFIFDYKKLHFLAVNNAAITKYGFSKGEFGKMNILDIRPEEDFDKAKSVIEDNVQEFDDKGFWRHKKKTGEIFWVHVFSHITHFDGVDARLILAYDINEQQIAKEKVRQQNQVLREIARVQSHQMRAPVATILGLNSVIDYTNFSNPSNYEVLEKLNVSVRQLDLMIKDIVRSTEGLDLELTKS
jgi:PAS domain S-box-containing protein